MKITNMNDYLIGKDQNSSDKVFVWKTAIGLQKVDNLENSKFLYEIAKKNIDGKISFEKAKELIWDYYISSHGDERTEEADKVALRIAEILLEKSFIFSSGEYTTIHSRLFKGIYKFAGKIRDYNISKNEWVLDGESVIYGDAFSLKETLEYDLKTEKEFSYKELTIEEKIKHIATFISNLWQNHIFGEGNTRTTAVFLLKYLNKLGFKTFNDTFFENSWYFRNALVRANYTDSENDIYETTEYLELFLRNLLLGENNQLSNEEMHVNYNK